MPQRRNSKSEARNPKQCQMSQIENSKRAGLQAVHFQDLEIKILDLFQISKFELRISKGKLNHFVNFVVTKKTWQRRGVSHLVIKTISAGEHHDYLWQAAV